MSSSAGKRRSCRGCSGPRLRWFNSGEKNPTNPVSFALATNWFGIAIHLLFFSSHRISPSLSSQPWPTKALVSSFHLRCLHSRSLLLSLHPSYLPSFHTCPLKSPSLNCPLLVLFHPPLPHFISVSSDAVSSSLPVFRLPPNLSLNPLSWRISVILYPVLSHSSLVSSTYSFLYLLLFRIFFYVPRRVKSPRHTEIWSPGSFLHPSYHLLMVRPHIRKSQLLFRTNFYFKVSKSNLVFPNSVEEVVAAGNRFPPT